MMTVLYLEGLSTCTLLRELLEVATITDFYSKMSELGDKLRLSQLLPSSDYIKVSVWV